MSQETVREIGHELQRAWRQLGGAPDLMPDYMSGVGLYEAFERLGAGSNLLGVIGSWRDTANDDEILQWLRLTNAAAETDAPSP